MQYFWESCKHFCWVIIRRKCLYKDPCIGFTSIRIFSRRQTPRSLWFCSHLLIPLQKAKFFAGDGKNQYCQGCEELACRLSVESLVLILQLTLASWSGHVLPRRMANEWKPKKESRKKPSLSLLLPKSYLL